MSRTMQVQTLAPSGVDHNRAVVDRAPSTPSTPLGSAAFRGDVATVKALLDTQSADTAADSWTPLIWAARAGRVDVMTLLLDAGADPNRRDNAPRLDAVDARPARQAGGRGSAAAGPGADGTRGSGGTSPLEMAALDNDVAMLRCAAGSPPSTRTAGSGVCPCGLGRRVGGPGSAAARQVPDRGRRGPAGLRQNPGEGPETVPDSPSGGRGGRVANGPRAWWPPQTVKIRPKKPLE